MHLSPRNELEDEFQEWLEDHAASNADSGPRIALCEALRDEAVPIWVRILRRYHAQTNDPLTHNAILTAALYAVQIADKAIEHENPLDSLFPTIPTPLKR